jgi:hypothetical protein
VVFSKKQHGVILDLGEEPTHFAHLEGRSNRDAISTASQDAGFLFFRALRDTNKVERYPHITKRRNTSQGMISRNASRSIVYGTSYPLPGHAGRILDLCFGWHHLDHDPDTGQTWLTAAIGTKRTFRLRLSLSAFWGKADIAIDAPNVR